MYWEYMGNLGSCIWFGLKKKEYLVWILNCASLKIVDFTLILKKKKKKGVSTNAWIFVCKTAELPWIWKARWWYIAFFFFYETLNPNGCKMIV